MGATRARRALASAASSSTRPIRTDAGSTVRMPPDFRTDPFPGRPKILFVGWGHSTHTHAWIDLLKEAEFNVRLFSLPKSRPPDAWQVRTYVCRPSELNGNPNRLGLVCENRIERLANRWFREQTRWQSPLIEQRWLASIIRGWRPDIIHSLGLESAAYYLEVRKRSQLAGVGRWVVQLRGGSDLTLAHRDPVLAPKIASLLGECDQVLSDNLANCCIAETIGIPLGKFASIGPVPGTGGLDVAALSTKAKLPPSRRTAILWPKAYECPWSKALPVLEALRRCHGKLGSPRIHFFACDKGEVLDWFRTLPAEMQQRCEIHARVPRDQVLEEMASSRVMLAPSLVDGVPNVLYEAMATGAFPIVSPLKTITPIVENEKNVLFARNLYPDEIAEALVRAFTDDQLVDAAAKVNLELVASIADRSRIRNQVIDFYEGLASDGATPATSPTP